jgi:hypothetical protein
MLMRLREMVLRVGVLVCVGLGALWLAGASAFAAGGFALPDGRMWEMVSPVEKDGSAIHTMPRAFGGLIQAAEDGNGIAYLSQGPVGPSPAGNPAFNFSQVLSRRGPGGWSSQDIATPNESLVNITLNTYGETEYKMFSPDLSVGLVEPSSETPLPPLPANAERTIYLRDDATGSYLPLVSAANVQASAKLGAAFPNPNHIVFEGGSPDLSHVAFSSEEALTANADAARGSQSLYEWAGGQLQLVSLLPRNAEGKEVPGANAWLGSSVYSGSVIHAVSTDGSRVIWEAEGVKGHHLYMRDTVRGETVQLDAVQPGAAGSGVEGATFLAASADGSRVFFIDEESLTENSQGANDLYVFEVSGGSGPLSGTLRDLTPESIGGAQLPNQFGLPGVSEDGSYVYFMAYGALSAGAVSGEPNLYMDHYGATGWGGPKLVAVLSPADRPDWAPLKGLTSRTSPNGRYLTFMSQASLTGYDNHDVVSGAEDEEVYLYDADTGRLVCVSCEPSGTRPEGIYDPKPNKTLEGRLLIDYPANWEERWLGGNIPGWTQVGGSSLRYQSHYLSDNGRLFFDSPGALVPGDVNGKEDVYEYEPVGVGGCEESTQGMAVVFSASAGGCVGLISSGTSSEESAFLDASAKGGANAAGGEGGGDVFFLTSAQLSPQDTDGAFDMYDAHECTSQSPCIAPAVVGGASCVAAEACRGVGSAPAAVGAPVTTGITGAGNLAPPPSTAPVVGRSLSRAQKLARALRVCRKEPRHRRPVCEARAHRAYRASSAGVGR